MVHGTKAQVFKTLKNSDLGEIKCSEINSRTLVSFAQELNKSMEPQTCGNYFSHLRDERRIDVVEQLIPLADEEVERILD